MVIDTRATKPPVWGVSAWGADCGRETRVLHEMSVATTARQTEPLNPAPAFTACSDASSHASRPLHNEAWDGAWDDRRWQEYRSFTRITFEPVESED